MNMKNMYFQILKTSKGSQLGPALQSMRTWLVTIQPHSPSQKCRLQTQYAIIPLPAEGKVQAGPCRCTAISSGLWLSLLQVGLPRPPCGWLGKSIEVYFGWSQSGCLRL